VTRQRDH
jgi:hypothetical protein